MTKKADNGTYRSPTDGRYESLWHIGTKLLRPYIRSKFGLSSECCTAEGPCLVISNHVTNWDPLLLAMSFPKKPLYYVASEHIFRWGLRSRLIAWLASPISRNKGSAGTDTARECIERLRSGNSIGLFAEGERTWDGRGQKVVPATGRLAKLCNATLITYRLNGLYYTLPRWGAGIRRGKASGSVVGIYPPERLAELTPEEVNAIINRDIYEDAALRQSAEPTAYKGRSLAEHLELAVFLCPKCGRIGELHSRGNRISCKCGFSLRMTASGAFDPATPFATVAEWSDWQRAQLSQAILGKCGQLFFDGDVTLSELTPGHDKKTVCTDTLYQYSDAIVCGSVSFALSDIPNMAIIDTCALALTCCGKYYELRPKNRCCLLKYLIAWQIVKAHNKSEKEDGK